MGTTKNLADAAFRDYVIDGVASSGLNLPAKSEIRATFADADVRLGALEDGQLSNIRVAKTWTELSAVIGAAGDGGEVWGDTPGATHTDPVTGGIVPNSGRYRYVEGSPSGWERIADDALASKAPLDSPGLTGTPTATTPPADNASTRIATTAFVVGQRQIFRTILGASEAEILTETIGDTTPNTAGASTAYIWGRWEQTTRDGWLQSATVRFGTSGSGWFVVVDHSGMIVSETAQTVAAGVNDFAFFNVYMPAGSRLFWRPSSGAVMRTDPTSRSAVIATADYSGVGARETVSALANFQIAMQFVVEYVDEAVAVSAASAQRRVDDLASAVEARNSLAAAQFWAVASPSIGRVMVGCDAGRDLRVGALVTGVTLEMIGQASLAKMIVAVYRRSTASANIETAPPIGEDVLISSVSRMPAEIGLTLGLTTISTVEIPVEPFTVEEGYSYFAHITPVDASGVILDIGLGSTVSGEARQRHRGYYIASAAGVVSNVSGRELSLGFVFQQPATVDRKFNSPFSRIDDASASYSDFALTARAEFRRPLCVDLDSRVASSSVSGTTTLATPTAGYVRYDLVYFDHETLQMGVTAGTERTTDAAEFVPENASPLRFPAFHARVTDAGITDVIPIWEIGRDGDNRRIAAALDEERRRGKACIRKFLGKVRRGAAVKIVTLGDSITALQSGSPAGLYTTPNGPERDRATVYLSVSIGSDLVSALPLYTAVQLGRADDGAGAVHTKFGYLWDFVGAIEDMGSTVTYDNFAVGGKSSADAVTAGVANAWVTNAIALVPDVAILHFGMNEIGNADTETRMVTIIEAFRAAGVDVIVMGLARRNYTYIAGTYNMMVTTRALERAARYAGAAHVSYYPIYGDEFASSLGMSKLDFCAANRQNHPGIREHARIGAELTKLLL